MATIKKQYVEIFELLKANENKKVSTIMDSILELVESKTQAKTYKRDEDGNVTHIFCYYHKEWESVEDVEYGKKSSNKTGLASMCKVGVSQWNRQQREMKLARANLLDQVANGEVEASEVPALLQEIEDNAKKIVPLGEES